MSMKVPLAAIVPVCLTLCGAQGGLPARAADSPETAMSAPPPTGFVTRAEFDELRAEVDATKATARATLPGTSEFNLAGYGSAGLVYQENEGDRLFYATFNPLFLWKLSDRLLFEGELEFELEGDETDTALEQAHLAYLLDDYVTADAGKFLNPMDAFVERFHMAWVNHLPDKPLAVYDGLLPESIVGAQLRGGVPVGPAQVTYAVFAGNAPALVTDTNADPGTLSFDNFSNPDGHFVYGGHIGFLPVPALEVGYGLMAGNVAPSGGDDVSALMQSVDFNGVLDSTVLSGMVRLNAQWVWSRLGTFNYGVDAFDNNRDGGYAQIAYRPTKWGIPALGKFEPVYRYDVLEQKDTPTGTNERRNTVGLNYWLTAMTVVKAAYQLDSTDGGVDHNAVLVQFATGF